MKLQGHDGDYTNGGQGSVIFDAFDMSPTRQGNDKDNDKGNGNSNGNGNGKGKGKEDGDFMPEFLSYNNLPQGLLNNPSQAVGVDLKAGKVLRGQKTPNLTGKKKATIRGLDDKPIKLDLATAERINVYHPNQYTVSRDGSYVTENETGKEIQLNVFYASDHKNQFDVLYSLNEYGYLTDARVSPKVSGDGPGRKDDVEMELHKNKGKIQNFQRLDNTNILVGYMDEDVDMTNAPSLGDVDIPKEDSEMEEGEEGNTRRNRRRTQATSTATRFGKTCTSWDWLDVRIATDKKFKDKYSDHTSKAQAVFAEAAEIYWKESCVWLYMWHYESTVGNPNWITPNGQHLDTRLSGSTTHSGCNGYGVLDIFGETARANQPNVYRDAWHLFSGANFSGNTIGCAALNVCKSVSSGYGVNQITFSTSLRLQAVLFAHELGHNLGLSHLSSTPGNWVMEPSINFAPWDLTNNNAKNVRNKVVESSACGWY